MAFRSQLLFFCIADLFNVEPMYARTLTHTRTHTHKHTITHTYLHTPSHTLTLTLPPFTPTPTQAATWNASGVEHLTKRRRLDFIVLALGVVDEVVPVL